MSIRKSDVEAILLLSEYFPKATADELTNLLKQFYASDCNRPEFGLEGCISRFVDYLLYTGQEKL